MTKNINENVILDVLREVSNIGSGNAVTALSKMIEGKISMDIPKVNVLDFKDVASILGGEENLTVGIYFSLEKDIVGNMMFALDYKSAINLSNLLYKRENKLEEFDEMDMSILSEIGNILASSYINSLADLTGMNIVISIPSLAVDMAGAILSVPAIQFGLEADKVIMIETMFKQNDDSVNGNFFLIPELESFNRLLKMLGAM